MLPLNTRYTAATLLQGIPREKWADHAFPVPRYGQRTSNLVEQQHNVYKDARYMPVLDMLRHIWKNTMSKCYERNEEANKAIGPLSTDATKRLRQDQDSARMYERQHSSTTTARVFATRNPQVEHIVRLTVNTTDTCTCGDFQKNQQPCTHACSFLDSSQRASLPFVARFHTKNAWSAIYSYPLPPILSRDLQPSDSSLPPLPYKRRGRAQKKRRETVPAPATTAAIGAIAWIGWSSFA